MNQNIPCSHCGDPCETSHIISGDHHFCCVGCQSVYEILNGHNLDAYYKIEQQPGIKVKVPKKVEEFTYLDNEQVFQKLINFQNEHQVNITFSLPQIHCSACIWLLEHLPKLHQAIIETRVDFLAKKCYLSYEPTFIKLSEVAALLASIGYEPDIRLKDTNQGNRKKIDWGFYTRLGIAGFCFGNIMLLSFPEYLSGKEAVSDEFRQFFGYLNLLLALPVLLYSSQEFFRSAWQGFKQRMFSIDVPIALGITVLFTWSSWEILSGEGAGYMDSLAGLVFFLLAGRWFQRKSYDRLSFDNDYSAYFPLSSTLLKNGEEKSIAISELKEGDRILIRHGELIPGDTVLLSERAHIDYSFVTGESEPVAKVQGDVIYAGGRQEGAAIELELIKPVSQSYLSQLWQQKAFKEEKPLVLNSISDRLSKHFTITILFIAFLAGGYWMTIDPAKAIQVFAAVLIVACPCGLALSVPITLGSAMRIMSKWGMFIKQTDVIERMGDIQHIVFDKTGTLTHKISDAQAILSKSLSEEEKQLVVSLAHQSTHPVSRSIQHILATEQPLEVHTFQETPGRGIYGKVAGHEVKIGSYEFTHGLKKVDGDFESGTFVSIDGQENTSIRSEEHYRPGLEELLKQLEETYELSLLSGDHPSKRDTISAYIPDEMGIHLGQKPKDKLHYIEQLQQRGQKVMMIGDGLNDAGAFKQSDLGIAITESQDAFSPACDAILRGESLSKLNHIFDFAKTSLKLVKIAFGISLAYNILGLTLAVQGLLSPLWVAILMPLSSITIVAFGLISTRVASRREVRGQTVSLSEARYLPSDL